MQLQYIAIVILLYMYYYMFDDLLYGIVKNKIIIISFQNIDKYIAVLIIIIVVNIFGLSLNTWSIKR